jgi:hypothetical protein
MGAQPYKQLLGRITMGCDIWDDEWRQEIWGDGEPQTESVVFDELLHTTEKAYLLSFGDRQVWVPKSISKIEVVEHENRVELPAWFVHQESLEYFIVD